VELIHSAPSPLRFHTSRLAPLLAQKPDSLQGALLTSEARASGWAVCAIALVNDANAWFNAIEDTSCENTRCAVDQAANSDGDLLLPEDQNLRAQVYWNITPTERGL
jgi:hypothetical protein